ncbi:MAG: hypothetical protein JW815_04360 [Candidatus Bathyarchaeota archaeon]|nr:hypothetical protein [Candidatus Bathyarchaeum sp.]
MSISTKEELQFLLHRAWEIEKKFESLSAWKGFVSVGQNFRSTVLTLARESYTHRLNLENLLKTLNLEMPTNEMSDGVFDFTGMLDIEAIQKIVENDEIVKDLYTKLVESTDPNIVSDLFGKKNADFLYQTLKRMIDDERRHISMVKKIAGRIERIQ